MAAGLVPLATLWQSGLVGSGLLLAGLAGRLSGRRARAVEFERSNAHLRADLAALRAAAAERERVEAASEAKSRFLATVSHEIRTPLGGIIGLADLLDGTALTREQQSYVAAIRTSGGALMTLIDDILDYSRVEAGRVEIAAEPFDVRDLVEGVVELLAPRAQGRGLEIASRVAGAVPERLVGDSHRLRQVLLNLAGNAVKFTEQGGVGIEVTRRADGTIAIAVADTGPGVPPDHRAAIFEEFEQVDGSASRRHGGAGLGLAIASALVGAMGGDIRLTDREGGGSVFTVVVPLPAAGQPLAWPVEPTSRRALVVSPTAMQSDQLHAALNERGVDVLRASSRGEAAGLLDHFGGVLDDLFVDCKLGETDVRALSAAAAEAGVKRKVLLFSPLERRAFGQASAIDYDAWLVKPIRDRSLTERLADGPSDETPKPRGRVPSAPDGEPLRVLLAEDNPVNALVARAALERLGAEVVHAENGRAAWEEAEASLGQPARRRFDLVLMDVCMPDLDGLEVTRRIRAAEARWGLPPLRVIATTADGFRETREACVQAGMDEVLVKPVLAGDLRRLVAPDDLRVSA